jgi:hypothetical protein
MPSTLDREETAVPDERDRPTVPLLVATRALGISRTSTYKARRNGKLPFRTIHVGGQYVVSTRELRQLLGLPVASYEDETSA